MKTIISILLGCLITTATIFAQSQNSGSVQGSQPFSIESFASTNTQVGNTNYQYSFSEKDLKNSLVVFYTDSNATVAYIKINGFTYKLSGGPNPEHILAYNGSGFTVTLSFSNNTTRSILLNSDDRMGVKSEGTLAVYNNKGQVIGKAVTGMQVNAVKK